MEKKELKTYAADEIPINKNNQEHWEKTLQDIEKLDGALIIEEGDFKLDHLLEVDGYIEVNKNADFTAPALTTIGSYFKITKNASFTAPALTTIGGAVYINENFAAPALTKTGDAVYVNKNFTAPALITIGGAVYVNENFTAPALITIGGNVAILENAEFTAPALTEIGDYVTVEENANFTAPALTKIGSDVYIRENADFTTPALTRIGGDVKVRTKLSPQMESVLWKAGEGRRWFLSDQCSEFLLSQTGDIEYVIYVIGDIYFDKRLFDAIRNGTLSAREVFQIPDLEQRQVAYERMDKSAMAELDYTVLDEKVDHHGNPMRLISFDIDGYDKPFLYLHCVCPSTKREYYLETNRRTCDEAKAASFGLDDAEFTAEW